MTPTQGSQLPTSADLGRSGLGDGLSQAVLFDGQAYHVPGREFPYLPPELVDDDTAHELLAGHHRLGKGRL